MWGHFRLQQTGMHVSLWDKMTEGLQVFLAGSEWDQLPLLGFPAALQKRQTRRGDAWSLDLYKPFFPMLKIPESPARALLG